MYDSVIMITKRAVVFCCLLAVSLLVLLLKINNMNHTTKLNSGVDATEGKYLFEERHKITKMFVPKGSNVFRFITYNILTDMYASTEAFQKKHQLYCPKYALSKEYRRPLILKELVGYHGDFINLQECGENMFSEFLKPKLKALGYEGFLMVKLMGNREGEALFYRKERYTHITDLSISVKDALYSSSNDKLLFQLKKKPLLLNIIMGRKEVGLIQVFRDKYHEAKKICIVNTHLYWKHPSHHIRLLQAAILMNYVKHNINKNVDVIFAGDLNSSPGDPAIRFLSGAFINEDDPVWQVGDAEDEEGLNLRLKSPITLKNLSLNSTRFTIYSKDEKNTVDHIFGSRNFEVALALPLPTIIEIMLAGGGLPSVGHPSDHLPLVLDITWHDHVLAK